MNDTEPLPFELRSSTNPSRLQSQSQSIKNQSQKENLKASLGKSEILH
jgi:hypothetical protein